MSLTPFGRDRAARAAVTTIECIATAPVGSLIATRDWCVMFRKYGPKKTDWESVVPTCSTDDPTPTDQERGPRAFVRITRLLRSEPLFMVVR